MVQWLKFFLVGIIETTNTAIDTFHKILALRDRIESKKIRKMGRRIPNAQALLIYLYTKPVVTAADVMRELEVTKQTAHSLIHDFEKSLIHFKPADKVIAEELRTIFW